MFQLESMSRKQIRGPPLFNPEDGVTVVEPPGREKGFWAGAPSVIYDPEEKEFLLYYRLRKPVGEGRGWVCYISRSRDGVKFKRIWTARREEFDSPSIERSALIKTPQDTFRLYVSYVDGENSRWRIDVLEADRIEDLNPSKRQPILKPDDIDSEGVKDPWVMIVGGLYYMYASYGPRSSITSGSTGEDLHRTGNVFVTGKILHPTGLALSADGNRFSWRGPVISPGQGWDRNVSRMSCALYIPPLLYAFYDGRTGEGDFYEDRTGYTISLDFEVFHKVTETEPVLSSPWGTRALRYLDAIPVGDQVYYYYECARSDGSHELRMNKVPLTRTPASQ